MTGVTEDGFNRKRLSEILDDKDSAVRAVFGGDIDLSSQSPDGQINGIAAQSTNLLWELAEYANNNADPDQAIGVQLAGLCKLNGVVKFTPTYSIADVIVTGIVGTIVVKDSLVRNSVTNTRWRIIDSVTIDATGAVSAQCSAVDIGLVFGDPNTITIIDSPIAGWVSIDNPTGAITGRNEESDAALRARRNISVAAPSQNLEGSIVAGVLDIAEVTHVRILDNDTDVDNPAQAPNVPAKSFETITYYGDTEDLDINQEIGEVIYLNKPLGSRAYGHNEVAGEGGLKVTVTVDDSQGFPHTVEFTRATGIRIIVVCRVTIDPEVFPGSASDLTAINEAIKLYAAGALIPDRGWNVGDTVRYTEMFTPINSVPGHYVNYLAIGIFGGTAIEDDVPINIRQIAEFLDADMDIELDGVPLPP